MSDKALRGNRLTAQGGGRIAGPARRAQEHGFYSPDMGMRGKFGYKHGKRAGYAIGSLVKAAKIIKKKLIKPHPRPIKKKKKVYPETEKLTHQKGPYVGDVGSEKSWPKRKKWEKPIGKFPPEEGRKMQPLKKGGSADKKWIQKATKGMVKTKPCTGKKFGSKSCPPGSRRYNLAKTFKKMGRERKAEGQWQHDLKQNLKPPKFLR